MKHNLLAFLLVLLQLALLSGCPNTRKPAAISPAFDTAPTTQAEISDTLPSPDARPTSIASEQASPIPEPKPAPEPKPPRLKTLPRMWDYGSDNCISCVQMNRILGPMITEYAGRVDIRIINVYKNRGLAQQARIQVIPTQIFYAPDGNELFRHVGVYPRDSIVAKFRELGWK